METLRKRATDAFILAFLALQLALPVRGLVRGKLDSRGDFTWNMYSQRYTCDGRYYWLKPDGQALRLEPRYMVADGRFSSVCHRDRLPRFHAWLCDEVERREPGSELRGTVRAAHNLGGERHLVTASTPICSAADYGVTRHGD